MTTDREQLTAQIQTDLDLLVELLPTDPIPDMLRTVRDRIEELERLGGLTDLQQRALDRVRAAVLILGWITDARDAWKGLDRPGGKSRFSSSPESD